MQTPELNKLILRTYREKRLLGYAQSIAKHDAAVEIARLGYMTVTEALAKLDYELSKASVVSSIADLI